MDRIILIERDVELRKLLSMNLDVYLGLEVVCLESAQELITYHSKHLDGVALIISNKFNEGENTSKVILDYLHEGEFPIPYILMNSVIVEGVNTISPEKWKDAIREAGRLLKITSKDMAAKNKKLKKFYPILVENLLNIKVEKCACDVYQITKSNEFMIIIEGGEEFPSILIDELHSKGVKHIYVHKEMRLKFINQFSKQVLSILSDDSIKTPERTKVTEIGLSTVSNMLSMGGLDQDTIKLADATVSSMSKVIDSGNTLTDLLKTLQENGDSYLFKHSMMTAAVGVAILSRLDWGNEDQQKTISFIALFHDITLTEDRYAKVSTRRELSELRLPKAEENKINKHAYDAAELIREYPKAPYSAASIILQHHGQLNGMGFATTNNSSLSPLAIVFKIAEEYAEVLLSVEPEFFDKKNILKKFHKKYPKGMFRTVVDVIEDFRN